LGDIHEEGGRFMKKFIVKLLNWAFFIGGVGFLSLAGILTITEYGWWGIPIMLINVIFQLFVMFGITFFMMYLWYIVKYKKITGFFKYITRR